MTTMVVMSSAPILSPLQSGVGGFSITEKSQVCLRQRLLFFPVKSVESRTYGLHHFRVVPSAMLTAEQNDAMVPEYMIITAEKEAVKDVLTLFLRKHGLTNEDATRTVRKSDCFIDHLVSRLQTIDKTRYLVGSELPNPAREITEVLVPYLESFLDEQGYILIDVLENFPNPPPEKEQSILDIELPSDIRYLIDDVRMDRKQIERLIQNDPRFYDCGLFGKIKPVVEFLLDLGLSSSLIFSILSKVPYVYSLSKKKPCVSYASQDIIPTLLYMESLGVDKKQWGHVISQSPGVLRYSCVAVKRVTEFFLANGYSVDDVLVMASLEDRLFGLSMQTLSSKLDFLLTSDYPKSQLVHCPYFFRYSLERRIKPRFAQLKEKGLKPALATFLGKKDAEFERILNLESTIYITPTLLYMESLGVDKMQWGRLISQRPRVLRYSYVKVKRVTEFFLANGYSVNDVLVMASLEDRLFGLSMRTLSSKLDFLLTIDIKPTLLYMESLGVDKMQWGRLISQCPRVLTYSYVKVKQVTEFFLANGYSVNDVLVMASLEDRLFGLSMRTLSSKLDFLLTIDIKPTLLYMESLGVDKMQWGRLISQHPRVLRYSYVKVKRVTEFFLANGYNVNDVLVMASLEDRLFGVSMRTLSSKLDFLLTSDYPKSQLVQCPCYFGYSLERRIKPRFAQLKERGLKPALATFLMKNDDEFERNLDSGDVDNL